MPHSPHLHVHINTHTGTRAHGYKHTYTHSLTVGTLTEHTHARTEDHSRVRSSPSTTSTAMVQLLTVGPFFCGNFFFSLTPRSEHARTKGPEGWLGGALRETPRYNVHETLTHESTRWQPFSLGAQTAKLSSAFARTHGTKPS